jgi:hypothetical protein
MGLYNAAGSYESALHEVATITTGQSFAGLQFSFVQINSSGQLVAPSAAGQLCDGVIQDDNPNSGTPSTIADLGISIVTAGAALNIGDLVASDSSGRAVTASGGQAILGRALGASSAAGTLVPVMLFKMPGGGGFTQTTITNAQILAMHATPITLVAAPGAGKFIQLDALVFNYLYLTAAFTSGGAFNLYYGATTGTQIKVGPGGLSVLAATFLTGPTANAVGSFSGQMDPYNTTEGYDVSANLLNQPVVLTNASGAFATGGGSLVVQAIYRTITGLS